MGHGGIRILSPLQDGEFLGASAGSQSTGPKGNGGPALNCKSRVSLCAMIIYCLEAGAISLSGLLVTCLRYTLDRQLRHQFPGEHMPQLHKVFIATEGGVLICAIALSILMGGGHLLLRLDALRKTRHCPTLGILSLYRTAVVATLFILLVGMLSVFHFVQVPLH